MKKVFDNKKVIAVIVTFNRKKLLKECIDALLSQNYKNCQVLVVDNASSDGTYDYIKKLIDNKVVFYTNTGSNLGGAGGFNYGMKKAYEFGCDYIWLMDDDCIVHDDTLSKLMEYAKELNGNFGFLSSKVLWKDDNICKMNIQKVSLRKKNDDWDTSKIMIIMATFVSFLVSVKVVEDVGLPITDFFIWADDLEYSRRISKKYNCYLINESVVTHKSKNNFGSNIAIDESENLNRYNYSYRNERYLFRREGLYGRLYYFLKLQFHKLKVLKSKVDNKKERLDIIKKASKEGKVFNPRIEYIPFDKKRVLYMYGERLSTGGQESFTLNVLKFINCKKIVIDLFTPYICENKQITTAVKNENGAIYAYNGRFVNGRGNKLDFYKYSKIFFKEYGKKYDIVHIHSGSTFALAIGAKIAKKNGVRNVIVHSHATGYDNVKHKIIKHLFANHFKKYADSYWACSKAAAYWKFPKKLVDSRCKIIKNTISVTDYKYDSVKRNKLRKEMKFGDNAFVMGTVGRISKEKNQLFLIDIFKKIYEENNDSYFVLVGDGPLMDDTKRKIELEEIKNVILLGNRDDICDILNILDVFVLPSIYEGFPITVVEAQANNLPCVLSDTITHECSINDNVIYLSLNLPIEKWAKSIINVYHNNLCRNSVQTKQILEYDTTKYVEDVEKEYLERI